MTREGVARRVPLGDESAVQLLDPDPIRREDGALIRRSRY
jgi:hypothetical protein